MKTQKHPQLIGLTGLKQSGKSTTADILVRDGTFARKSFATPIKSMLATMGVLPHEMDDKEKVIPRFNRSPRQMMQTLGTEWGRKCVDDNHWVNIAKRDAFRTLANGYSVVFDDVRFDNEAQMIRDLGGTVWQIIRTKQQATDPHVSEAGVSFDLIYGTIWNEGDVTQLVDKVRKAAGLTLEAA